MKALRIVSALLIAGSFTLPTGAQRVSDHRYDARETLLESLGQATLDCLGTLGPSLYETSGGVLARTFRTCTTGDARALARIDALLGVQNSLEGQRDGLGDFYVARWATSAESFVAVGVGQCPRWTLLDVIDAPTEESVARIMRTGRIGKQNARYRVTSSACGEDGGCAVRAAVACAEGFGSQFVVEVDARRSRIEVDPAWWLLDLEFDNSDSNPFLGSDYYHGMSHIGEPPGALYAAIERAGEACSVYNWITGNHYSDGVLVPVDCGGGWLCASYCTWIPQPKPPSLN